MQSDNWIFNIEEIREIREIVNRYIPLGLYDSNCHFGICSLKDCSRCKNAIRIREFIDRLER